MTITETGRPALARAAAWLRAGRSGMFLLALLVGVGAGLGAVAFRYLVYFFTWLATGHDEFGQAGYVGSSHLPWLGLGFFVVIPAIGGLLYGPLIYNWAREARGHGVPEVMVAVADNGGRIRWQVAVVKSLASALCIGSGGSVGREGPIVQIGSALASSLGQWVKLPENRLRIMVACGAAGGIRHLQRPDHRRVLRRRDHPPRVRRRRPLHRHALGHDRRRGRHPVPRRQAVPFRVPGRHHAWQPAQLPARRRPRRPRRADRPGVQERPLQDRGLVRRALEGPPGWARPVVLGLAFGLLLLALPQMYGVGYPVMFKATAGDYAIWFLIVLAFGKILATSVTMGIGGSGGIFAPSLFIGVTMGMAYGDIADHLFGAAPASPPSTPSSPWARCSPPPPEHR